MKDRRRRKRRVRKRDWQPSDVDAPKELPRRLAGIDVGLGQEAVAVEDRFSDIEANAVVVSPYGVLAFAEHDGTEYLCRVAEKLNVGKTSILAPGDEVVVDFSQDEPVVSAVKTRRSKLSRPAIRGSREQVFAANVDVLAVVCSNVRPRFKPGLIDRYMVAAEVGNVHCIVVVNKMDLDEEEPAELAVYRDLGLPVFLTSCVTGRGLDELKAALASKRSVLTGHSGVGKSSIINYWAPQLDLETLEVSRSNDKGRHSTTCSRLYHIDGDVHIIDTPGIRHLGLWSISTEELALYFPEMEPLAAQCRFRDCTHIHEPECAVLEAVQDGRVSKLRYESYRRIRQSL